MTLSPAQKATLKAAILADQSANAFYSVGDLSGLAGYYNALVSPAFYVYRTAVPTSEIFDAVIWANFTPSDAVPTDTSLNNDIFQSRQLACQTKQMNLQTMLTGREAIDGSKANIRAGLQDALTNIPSGANGATRAAGWVTLRDGVLVRLANGLEKLFATGGNGATAQTAATLVVEGGLSPAELVNL